MSKDMNFERECARAGVFKRTVQFDRASVNADARTVEMAFSSEIPYERWWGIEVLDHSASSVDLSRLNDGRHPLLVNHDPEKQPGVIEKAWLGEDRKGRSLARFGRSAYANEVFIDVQDEIRTLVSVGYRIDEIIEESKQKDGTISEVRKLSGDEFRALILSDEFARSVEDRVRSNEDPPVFRVTRWTPYENSLVAIPADADVGVGRGLDLPPEPEPQQPQPEIRIMSDPKIKEPAELERERTSALLDLGQQYAKYIEDKDVADAIRNGRSVDQFRDVIMSKMQAHHTDTSQLRIGMEKKEIQRYSIARAVAAAITGDWKHAGLERSASEAVGKMLGKSPEGFFVPYDAFQRDFNVGTGSEAGNLVPTDLRTDLFVDVLRNNLVIAGLGLRILPGLTSNIDIPKKTVASAIGMVTEIQALTETNPNTGKVSLTPKRMGGYVEYSKQALIQSAMAIEPMLRDDLLTGLALNIQDQVINGSGAGANMRGIRNTSGIGSVVGGTNGAALAWTHIVGLESACANANAEPDQVSGYLINTKARGTTKTTQKATNLPFIWDNGMQPLNGYKAAVSNTVPSNLTKGTSTTVCSSVIFGADWSMAVLGLFGAPDITVDPYSLATTGQVRITLNHFADHGVRIAAAFASMEDALTP